MALFVMKKEIHRKESRERVGTKDDKIGKSYRNILYNDTRNEKSTDGKANC